MIRYLHYRRYNRVRYFLSNRRGIGGTAFLKGLFSLCTYLHTDYNVTILNNITRLSYRQERKEKHDMMQNVINGIILCHFSF